jgi:cell division protein FtsX
MARAWTNIRQNIFVNVVTVGTITLALLILSLFLLVFVNLENAAENWSERVRLRSTLTGTLLRMNNRSCGARFLPCLKLHGSAMCPVLKL